MGGSSKNTNSYKSNTLGNSTTTNPYAVSQTNNNGTNTAFLPNTALETIYNSVNQNMGNLINEYLNPTLNSTTNKAKLKSFTDNLKSESYKNLENNIINPLAKRNMIRSSQATDMYNKNAQNTAGQIASFTNDLLANSQNQSADIINNLLNAYMKGYSVIKDTQAQSLNTSKTNGATTTNNSSAEPLIDKDTIKEVMKLVAMFANKAL